MKIDKKIILICDDSILARKQLKDIISKAGTPIFLEAADGQDGAIVLTNNAGNVADGDWSNRGESSMQVLLLILIISLAIISIFIIVYAYNRSKKRKKKYK